MSVDVRGMEMEVFREFALLMNNDVVFIALLYLISFIFVDKRRIKEFSIYFFGAIVFTFLSKELFYKERICGLSIADCPTNSAFPSGHALMSFASAFYFYKDKDSFLLISIFAFIISISRVYIGVHSITDVIGGFSFALFYFSLWWKNAGL